MSYRHVWSVWGPKLCMFTGRGPHVIQYRVDCVSWQGLPRIVHVLRELVLAQLAAWLLVSPPTVRIAHWKNFDIVESGGIAAIGEAFDANFVLRSKRDCESAVTGGS